jgi:diaminohydroxyphosphoribosylaminopyrimidine deaminase / 5-amino-6-(5-phosphoribosylamino)uracil reductase
MTLPRFTPDWTNLKADYWLSLVKSVPRDQLMINLERPRKGQKLSDDAAMFLAYAEALQGVGKVAPNPLVGAVLLDHDGAYLASAAHQRVGRAHAEVEAIGQLSSMKELHGGTIFVTLEPCSHQGRTPPCADFLVQTPLKRVVFGLNDPNVAVNGRGEKKLRKCGKIVDRFDRWHNPCEWLARVFIKNQLQKKIFIGMKVASTASGIIAGQQTSRLWITNSRSRQMGHFLRLEYDAVCVGAHTVLLDDPSLDVRHPNITGRMPLRVVVDGEGLLLKRSKALKLLTHNRERTLLILPEELSGLEKNSLGVNVIWLPVDQNGEFSWSDIQRDLWERGITSLLLEGGARLYESATRQSVIDCLHWFVGADRDINGGLKWQVDPQAFEIYKNGGGVPLDGDKLIEIGPGLGGKNLV